MSDTQEETMETRSGEQPRSLAIFGASGRLGRALVAQALVQGHQVTALVRQDDGTFEVHPRLRVVAVDLDREDDVAAAIRGRDAVISALGSRAPMQPHTDVQDGVGRVIAAMRRAGVGRLVSVGAAGLLPGEGGRLRGEVGLPPFLQHAFADHRAAFERVRATDLDWTVLCPPFMPEGARTGTYRTAVEDLPAGGQQIATGDVADLALQVLRSPGMQQARIGIAY